MKLTFLLVFLGAIQLSASVYSQNAKLSLDLKNRTVKEVLQTIEEQSNFRFFYNEQFIDLNRKVSVSSVDQNIESILSEVFDGASISFKVMENNLIIITPTEGVQTQQAKTVTGKVTDSSGQLLPGVTVVVKGTTTGTITDFNGNYTLAGVPGNATLVFSFVGMKAQEIVVAGKATINVKMEEETVGIEEVVAIGYGTQKKESMTSAVVSIKGDDLIQSIASSSVSNMLLGRVSGITAIQDQGAPGNDQSRIYIRGLATTGSNDPLYVIDGIPRSASDFQRLSAYEIDNISILKDASASAVYGARGANGVILITTKRGVGGKTNFNYSFNYGLQTATRLPEYMDAYGYANLYNKAMANEGRTSIYSADDLQKYKDGSDPIFHPNTNWFDILKGSAPMQQHNLTVDGGTEKVRYFLSFNYLNQKSLLSNINSDLGYDRYNFRSNIDVNATNTTVVSLDVSGNTGTIIEPGAGYGYIFENINRTPAIKAAKYPNGLNGPGITNRNAWAVIDQSGYGRNRNSEMHGRLEISQKLPFIDGLSLKGIASYDYYINDNKSWFLPTKIYNAVATDDGVRYDQVGGFNKPSISNNMSLSPSLTLEFHAMYKKSFGNHNVSGLAAYSQNEWKSDDITGRRSNFLSDQLEILSAGDRMNETLEGSSYMSRRQSIIARGTYDYDSKYLLEASFRYDGSDRFSKNHRFGFFPAISLGWVISKEKFFENISFIDFLKLRGSYGELGNDNIGQAPWDLYGYSSAGVPMGNGSNYQNSIVLQQLGNALVTWEKSKKANVGFELNFLKDISFKADYFKEMRSNILGQRTATVPYTFGLEDGTLPSENFEEVENKGVELEFGYNKSFSNGLIIQSRLNFSHARNTVLDIGEPDSKPDRIKQEGRPLFSQFGYKSDGLFQSEAEITTAYGNNHPEVKPGDIKFLDLDGDKKIDGSDITYIGRNNLPESIFGWNTIFCYKNVELSMFWQAGMGGQQRYGTWFILPFEQAGNALKVHDDYWRPDNTDAKYPRILTTSSWNNLTTSDYWQYNQKYLRLKNIEVAYNLPVSLVKKIYAKKLRIYFNAVNLLTFSPVKEVDPENTNAVYGYPQQIVWNFGAQITF